MSEIRGPTCADVLRGMDSCLGHDPQTTGPEQAILEHIGTCPSCSAELAARRRVSQRLRRAVLKEPFDPALGVKIRLAIEEHESRRRTNWSVGRRLAPVAAVLLTCLGGAWTGYQRGHLRITRSAQEAYVSSISEKVGEFLSVGLGDHVHCAVYRKLPEEPQPAAQLIAQLGPEFSGLLPIVRTTVPRRYKVVAAHRCSYHGRAFLHFALTRSNSGPISLLITRKARGESFDVPAIHQGAIHRFAIAGFQSGGFLVYLVSQLSRQENLDVLLSLAQPVRTFLGKLEA